MDPYTRWLHHHVRMLTIARAILGLATLLSLGVMAWGYTHAMPCPWTLGAGLTALASTLLGIGLHRDRQRARRALAAWQAHDNDLQHWRPLPSRTSAPLVTHVPRNHP